MLICYHLIETCSTSVVVNCDLLQREALDRLSRQLVDMQDKVYEAAIMSVDNTGSRLLTGASKSHQYLMESYSPSLQFSLVCDSYYIGYYEQTLVSHCIFVKFGLLTNLVVQPFKHY